MGTGAGADQPTFCLASIAGGSHDAYIGSWARDAYGRPLLLRFDHQMKGSWYPWAAAANGGSAEAYVAA